MDIPTLLRLIYSLGIIRFGGRGGSPQNGVSLYRGLYKYNVMVLSLKNAPETFLKLMNNVLCEFGTNSWLFS